MINPQSRDSATTDPLGATGAGNDANGLSTASAASGTGTATGTSNGPAIGIGIGGLGLGGIGLGRAVVAPVRAVSRIFTAAAGPKQPSLASRPRDAVVDCAVYAGGVRQTDLAGIGYAEAFEIAQSRDDAFVWVGLHEPDAADLAGIASAFQLDDFAVEDAIKGGQRPKLEQYGEMTFLVARTTRYVEHAELTETSEVVETGDLLMFIGRDFVVTVRHGKLGGLGPVRADLEARPELLALGPWAVAYQILDRTVDGYLDVATRVEEDIDEIEEHVFSRNAPHGRVARIYQLKRELVEFKRAVIPLQRPLAAVAGDRLDTVPAEVRRYFRDVTDHLARTVDQVVSYDDLLNSILQARLTQVTVDQNHDMRKIAAWAGIAAFQTAIAGIYGMNFDYMPELRWRYGYPLIMLLMLGAAVGMYRAFRRSGWL